MRGVASFVGSTAPRFVDLPEPGEPATGQVLCRTLELGICGTDRDILASAQPWTAPQSEFLVLGHECLARVEAVGPGVLNLRPGDPHNRDSRGAGRSQQHGAIPLCHQPHCQSQIANRKLKISNYVPCRI